MPERIDERIIDVTARFLGGLERSEEVVGWAMEHQADLETFLVGYDELIHGFNQIAPIATVLDIMTETKKLKEILGTPIPTVEEMSVGNYAHALMEARGPMLTGKSIKKGDISHPTDAQREYAIGTTSMDTTHEALAVGTMGHLIERTFFQWAKKNELIPPEGKWKKDMFLQVLDEVVMLWLSFEGPGSTLADYFINPNDKGGLGWISAKKLRSFRAELKNLFGDPWD